MFPLLQRQVIQFEGIAFRILLVEQHRSAVWLFNLETQDWPILRPLAALSEALEASGGPELHDKWLSPITVLTKDETAYAKRNFEIIAPLIGIEQPSEAFERGCRCRALDRQAQFFQTSRQTVTALLKKYWRGGMTLHTLVPSFGLRGGRGKKRHNASQPLGRPRILTQGPKIIVDVSLAKIFDKGIKRYEKNKSLSLVDVYEEIIQSHFKELQIASDGVPALVLKSPYPSLKQFYYYYTSASPHPLRVQKKLREKHYQLNVRPITGRADQKVVGPGHRFQIDATVWDVYLRSSLDRRRIVGRPTVYLVIDEFSRLIVGFYIGFEAASWAAASLALINMVTPKVEFCSSIGIRISEDDWPAAAASARLLADRGELFTLHVGEKLAALNIVIDNTPPYRADRKPIVESRFRILPAIFMAFVPGVVEKDWGERGAKDPRLASTMSLGAFRKMLVYAILQHNREPITDYKPIPGMVTDGLIASPNNLWRWGISNLSGQPKSVSVEEMSLAVLHEGRASITPKGIFFEGQYYSCPTAVARGWFTRLGGSKECTVRYDSMSLSRIIVIHDDIKGGYEFAERIGFHASEINDFSIAEFRDISDENKRLLAISGNGLLAKRVADNIAFGELAGQETRATKLAADPEASKRSLVSNIRSNKADEQRAIQVARGGLQSTSAHHSQKTPDLMSEKEDEYVDLLSQIDQE